MPRIDRIVLVGHCGFDAASLRHAAARVEGIEAVESVNDQASLEAHVSPDRLLLINRVLDGRFDVDHGVELIKRLRQAGNPPRMMLISDYPDAQQAAEDAGALPGFGKAQTHHPQTAAKLAEAVVGQAQSSA